MPIEIKVPWLGHNVEKATVTQWLKTEGQELAENEVLAEVEAEKAVMEIESPQAGILAGILTPEGSIVKPGDLMGYIALPGESIESPEKAPGEQAESEETVPGALTTDASDPPLWIAVIGGGPGGYAAAAKAAGKGARVTLIEKAKLGGTCLHTGCMPTKAYLSTARTIEKLTSSDLFLGADGVTVDLKKLMASKDKAVGKLTRGIESLMKRNRIEVVAGEARLVDRKRIAVRPHRGETYEIEPDAIVLAAGSVPSGIPGAEVDGRLVHNTDTVWNMDRVPKRLLVAGSGAVGVELACIYNALGSSVTLVEMLDTAMPGLDREIADILAGSIKNRGITLLTSTAIMNTEKNGTTVRASLGNDEKTTMQEFDCVLIACGRRPETDGLGLENAGIDTDRGAVAAGPDMKTNVERIYAIGDIIGPPMLAHAAFHEADIAVENIFGGSLRVDYRKIPYCVYSFPEVGCVGYTEARAKEIFPDCKTTRFPFYANGKAVVCGETDGMVKIIYDDSLGEILGVHIIGEHATELIANFVTAISAEITIDEIASTIMAHPTLSEAMTEAAQAALGNALHLPK